MTNLTELCKQIEALPDEGLDCFTVITAIVTDLKALAASHQRLLEAAKELEHQYGSATSYEALEQAMEKLVQAIKEAE